MKDVLSWARFGRSGVLTVFLAAFSWVGVVNAQLSDGAVYFEAGRAWHDGGGTNAATLGVRVPTAINFVDGRISLAFDVYVSQWIADTKPWERSNYLQVGVVPVLRYRFDAGRSPWFVEGGIGVSYLHRDYISLQKEFGSRWNFSDHLGAGYSFGTDRRHSLGVHLKHVSNAGLKKPNPGETFILLRYAYTL